MAGGESLAAARSIAHLLAETLPDARFVELEGSGHATYVDAPEEFARMVVAFALEVAPALQTG